MIKAYISRLESGASCWYKAPIVFYLSLLSAVIIPVKFLPSSYWNSFIKQKVLLEWKRSKCVLIFLFYSSLTHYKNIKWLSLLLLGLQYKGNMWEGRYRHCLQAFQSFLSKLFKRRQDADCGYLRKCWW